MIPEEIQKFLVNVDAEIEKEEIQNLPIEHIKGMFVEVAKKLRNIADLKIISDLANKIVPQDKIQVLKLSNISENDLEKWQSLGTYIVEVVQGKVEPTEKKKILLAGLENAGKTAILNILTKRFNISNLQPTKNVDVAQLTSKNVTFSLWDMGGQEEYRKIYVAHPERFFTNLYAVVYVMDVLDKDKYEISYNYLTKILDILESFSESPDFSIFLHKADPQVYDQIKEDLKEIEEKIKEEFKNRNFYYRIFQTSIYNTILTESNMLDSLSNLFEVTKQTDISPGLLESVQNVYNTFLGFSYVVEEKFQYLDGQLNNVEDQIRHILNTLTSTNQIVSTTKQKETPFRETVPLPEERRPASPREALTSELKRLFQKRKIS
jgi:GTP-binding protein EngB required for normal cell division